MEILVEVSQHTNIRLRIVAEMITSAASGKEPLPQAVQEHLAAAVGRRR